MTLSAENARRRCWPCRQGWRPPQPQGLTLVELLVVVTIMVILIGVVLPLAQPALKGREVREASRQVNTAFASARVRAEAAGSAYGVILVPDATGERCYEIGYAKVPPPYSGDNESWRAGFDPAFGIVPNPPSAFPFAILNDPNTVDDDFVGKLDFAAKSPTSDLIVQLPAILTKLLQSDQPNSSGDFVVPFQVQLGYRGRYHKGLFVWVSGGTGISGLYVAYPQSEAPTNEMFGPVGYIVGTAVQGGVPFQIRRAPRRTSATPIELPIGAYIDLTASGSPGIQRLVGTNRVQSYFGDFRSLGLTSPASIAIMFSSDGRVDRVYQGGNVAEVRNPVFLLIGSDKTATTGNLKKLAGSQWAVVDPSTGVVRTTDNLVIRASGGNAVAVDDATIETIVNDDPSLSDSQRSTNAANKDSLVVGGAWATALSGPNKGGR